jgi:hypothetical protein
MGVAPFTICAFLLFLVCFWNSDQDNAPLLVLRANEIAFFCLQPYLYFLVNWRDYMSEEAEAEDFVNSYNGVGDIHSRIRRGQCRHRRT